MTPSSVLTAPYPKRRHIVGRYVMGRMRSVILFSDYPPTPDGWMVMTVASTPYTVPVFIEPGYWWCG